MIPLVKAEVSSIFIGLLGANNSQAYNIGLGAHCISWGDHNCPSGDADLFDSGVFTVLFLASPRVLVKRSSMLRSSLSLGVTIALLYALATVASISWDIIWAIC